MNLHAIRPRVFGAFRRRRMAMFYRTFQPSAQTRLLDIGGGPNTWIDESRIDEIIPVTLVNTQYPDPAVVADARFTAIYADATSLPLDDASFDIVFSNSVIEHMTSWERQQEFAAEARRVGKKLWIQTPARCFPIEPHLLAPFFQYWPKHLQRSLARYCTLWGILTQPDATAIDEMISDIRLLTYSEFRKLFPDCLIVRERYLGLTKSYIAISNG